MAKYDTWKVFKWHCPNCGTLVTGFRNEKGDIKADCCTCKVSMILSVKTEKHETLELYAPRAESF